MKIAWLVAADATALLHLAFVLFVSLGSLLVFRRPAWAWVHLPALAWGVLVEFNGWVCPLTPLENWFRDLAGAGTYDGDFIGKWLLACLYPEGLTRGAQIALGLAAIGVNAASYGVLWVRRARCSSSP